MIKCVRCHNEKNTECFTNKKNKILKICLECREKGRDHCRKWRSENKEKVSDYNAVWNNNNPPIIITPIIIIIVHVVVAKKAKQRPHPPSHLISR